MSSNKNNNLALQNLTAPISSDFVNSRQGTSSSSTAPMKRSQTEQGNNTQRGRSGKRNHGKVKHGGPLSRNDFALAGKETEKTLLDAAANVVSPNQNDSTNADSLRPDRGRNEVNPSLTGRVRGSRPNGSRGGNGEYRQRNHTDQLLEGMSNMTCLDIDLAESIVPTSSSSGRSSEMAKGNRHASNSRKVNLTHLLNYKFERKQRGARRQHSPSSSYSNNNSDSYHRNNSSHYRDPGTIHKFSKQQFLQANCQFVVLDGHDYTVHKVDPDWPVDWDCIEEVRFKQSASTETTCPICLEPPAAAKITRCGHIYCWTCMLHYLSLSDENCRQCPICFEPVYKSDLRSVVSHSFTNHSVKEEIVMKLMVRNKGCVEVEPFKLETTINAETFSSGDQKSIIDIDDYWSQANLVIVDPLTVITKIAQRERDELLIKLELGKNEPEVCFIEQAIDRLQKRVEKLHQLPMNKIQPTLEPESKITSPLSPHSESARSYLFYQCSDGQHIYLNPFSTKILCHEYGSLQNCPLEIKAEILQMDWISMSEAWRKRFRYLAHLPLTCEFRLIEIDFENSNLISQDTYKVFEEQIKRREQEREKRRRDERKREKIIQVEQNRKIYGIQPTLKINLNNTDQFPSVSDERYLGLTQPRNQPRTDEQLSSDDDNIDFDRTTPVSPAENQTNIPANEKDSKEAQIIMSDSKEACAGMPCSFKDIQLQEAAKAAAQEGKPELPGSSGIWGNQKQIGSTSSKSSSFAQLLVDAKTSQKEWTRNIGHSSNAVANVISSASSSQRHANSSTFDEENELELRAPPGEFTISDFIDVNLSTGSKKRGKSKNVGSKKN